MKIENGVYKEVPLSWTGVTPPIKAGTPLDIDGVISNDGDAIGIVTQDIQYDVNAVGTHLLVGGDVILEEVEAAFGDELETEAKAAMAAIRFHNADGSIDDSADSDSFPKAANIADSTASTVAGLVSDFNDLLAALKEAGLMEPDEEESEEDPA